MKRWMIGRNKIEHDDNELGNQKTTYDMHWILELAHIVIMHYA